LVPRLHSLKWPTPLCGFTASVSADASSTSWLCGGLCVMAVAAATIITIDKVCGDSMMDQIANVLRMDPRFHGMSSSGLTSAMRCGFSLGKA
jgi:hypothetical protein